MRNLLYQVSKQVNTCHSVALEHSASGSRIFRLCVRIKSRASTYNLDILAVCFLAGQSTFHHREATETSKVATFHEITYIIIYHIMYPGAGCIVSHHQTSFSDTNAWRQLVKGSHTTSCARANHACDKKHRLRSTNIPQKWFEIGWDEPLSILLAWMSQQKLCKLNQLHLKDGIKCSWSESGAYLCRRVALHTSAEFGHALHRSLCLDPLRRREPLQTNMVQEVER